MPEPRWRTLANKVIPPSLHGTVRTTFHRVRDYVPSPGAAARVSRLGLGRPGDLEQWLIDGCPVPATAFRKRQTLYELLASHPVEVSIETGTLLGDTTAFLAHHSRKVVTIELMPELVAKARERFASTPAVEVVEGDSGKVLGDVLTGIDEPALFWLDGHYSGSGTAKGDVECPLLDELEVIGRWPHAKASIIAIDDAAQFGVDPAYPTLADAKAFAQRIGWDCFTMANDIIVMHPYPTPRRVGSKG